MKKKGKKQVVLTPVIDTGYHIGMRVIKTAVAVIICLIISLFIKMEDFVTVSAISAIIALQPSGEETLRTAFFRLIGTFVGVVMGLVCLLVNTGFINEINWIYVITVPVMIIINLYVCNVFKLQDAAVMACMLIVMMNSQTGRTVSEAISYSVTTLIETLAGVSVSTVLNFTFRKGSRVRYYEVADITSDDSEESRDKEKNVT